MVENDDECVQSSPNSLGLVSGGSCGQSCRLNFLIGPRRRPPLDHGDVDDNSSSQRVSLADDQHLPSKFAAFGVLSQSFARCGHACQRIGDDHHSSGHKTQWSVQFLQFSLKTSSVSRKRGTLPSNGFERVSKRISAIINYNTALRVCD